MNTGPSRPAYKTVGVSLIVSGLLIATLIAWVLTKAPTSWEWAYEYGGSLRSFHQYNVAVMWAYIIGFILIIAGVITLLVGRARLRRS